MLHQKLALEREVKVPPKEQSHSLSCLVNANGVPTILRFFFADLIKHQTP